MIPALRAILGAVLNIPALGRWLERIGLVVGTAWAARRQQRQAQELADATARMERAETDLTAEREGGQAAKDWLRRNRKPRA